MNRGVNPVLVGQRPDVLPMSYPCLWLHSTTCVVKVGLEKRPKSPKGKDDDDVHVITINSTKFNFCSSSCARRAHVSCTFFAHFLHVFHTVVACVEHVFHVFHTCCTRFSHGLRTLFTRFPYIFHTFSIRFPHVFRTILALFPLFDTFSTF